MNRSAAPPVDHRALIAAANRPGPAAKEGEPPRSAGVAPRNEVVEILRENARTQAPFEKPVDLTPRPNRRRLDYLVLMAAGNGLFCLGLVLGWGNPSVMVFSFSGAVIFSGGITWVMYGVMDHY